jgi:low affinity Fe/Cu permease
VTRLCATLRRVTAPASEAKIWAVALLFALPLALMSFALWIRVTATAVAILLAIGVLALQATYIAPKIRAGRFLRDDPA